MSVTYPLPQKGYPVPGRNAGEGLTKQYCYVVPLSTATSYIPADNSQDLAGDAGYVFSSATFSPHGDASLLYMYLNYKANTDAQLTSGKREVGSVVKRASVSINSRPIEEHPSWNGGVGTFAEEAIAAGRKIFLDPTVTYTYSQTYSGASLSVSESLLIGSIGATGAPVGLSGATSSKWMLMGTEIVQEGNNVNVDKIYQYSKLGWPFDGGNGA